MVWTDIRICWTRAATVTGNAPSVGDAVTVSLDALDHKISIPFFSAGIPRTSQGQGDDAPRADAERRHDWLERCAKAGAAPPTGVVEERGAVLVIMAAAMPAIILLLALAMDIGNWYIHTSQLKTRADAAALAAGLEYTTRFRDCALKPATTNTAITKVARQYAGAPVDNNPAFKPDYNDRVNADVRAWVNVKAEDVDSTPDPGDWTNNPPCDPTHPEGPPGYWTQVDVRDSVSSFFSGFHFINPKFYARARVAVMEASTASGMRPLVSARCVRASFTNGTVTLNGAEPEWNQWSGTAPAMPTNDTPVAIQIGCAANVFQNMAYVTRLSIGAAPRLTQLQLAPTNQAQNPCTNANPYFIPYDRGPMPDDRNRDVLRSGPTSSGHGGCQRRSNEHDRSRYPVDTHVHRPTTRGNGCERLPAGSDSCEDDGGGPVCDERRCERPGRHRNRPGTNRKRHAWLLRPGQHNTDRASRCHTSFQRR